MSKLFYDHLIVIEEVVAVLDEHGVKTADRKKILTLMDEVLHQEILDAIFTYLPREKHEEFLALFLATPGNPKHMEYLKEHSSVNIELAILDRANKTKRKLLKEINQK